MPHRRRRSRPVMISIIPSATGLNSDLQALLKVYGLGIGRGWNKAGLTGRLHTSLRSLQRNPRKIIFFKSLHYEMPRECEVTYGLINRTAPGVARDGARARLELDHVAPWAPDPR
jgi:hypothetical protein